MSFDPFVWVHDHLVADLPDGWLVTPERDAKVNRYPALVWSLSASHRGDGIWNGNLTLNLLCTVDDAGGAILAVQDAVGAWQTPGPLNTATLLTLTQNPGSDVAETIKQYVLVYSLTWDL